MDTHRRISLPLFALALYSALAAREARAQALPPPPVPPGNPLTEPKRVLGKILFWDERLSSGNTIACGSCHGPLSGGGDSRVATHPGPDGIIPSPDDIFGSPGVVRVDASGVAVEDPLFGFEVQVTPRAANTTLGAVYAPELFWDGRARGPFFDPETGAVSLPFGGALENQSVAPILSDVEMAREERSWADVRAKLESSLPLADATDLPSDVAEALQGSAGYPELFAAAFGDPAITGERIAFALASYERTLVPNQTPWDQFVAGNATAMTPGQVQGWNFFQNSPCQVCHTPPFFTNQSFRNLGLRPPAEDPGRQNVTGLVQDRGKFKVPTLRNVGLKPTHMHNGRLSTVLDSVLWYRPQNPDRFPDNLDPILPILVPPQVRPALVDFISNALTDPRVEAHTFPFDRPTLHGGELPLLDLWAGGALTWPALEGAQQYHVYRGSLASLQEVGPDGLPATGYGTCISTLDPDLTDTALVDPELPPSGEGFFYLKSVVDGTGAERGLGATSAGKARVVLAPCPGAS